MSFTYSKNEELGSINNGELTLSCGELHYLCSLPIIVSVID
jgi:hypothetical protein